MVSQRFMGTGFGLSMRRLRASMGMANPRFAVTVDFMVMMPWIRPCLSSIGPPLLPGSTGMASWSIMPNSISRRADRTP